MLTLPIPLWYGTLWRKAGAQCAAFDGERRLMEPAIGVLHMAAVMDVLGVALAAVDPYRAVLKHPAEGSERADQHIVTDLLLRAGATINELNAVRKHLSRVSGGQLARVASPARVLSLILSDVAGSPLDVIASGLTAPDPTTFADALVVLARRANDGDWEQQ